MGITNTGASTLFHEKDIDEGGETIEFRYCPLNLSVTQLQWGPGAARTLRLFCLINLCLALSLASSRFLRMAREVIWKRFYEKE